MRLSGGQPGPFRRAIPWIVALVVLGALAFATIWARQQESARRLAESRADLAEAELVSARASLTAVVRAQAVASATALARQFEPGSALERALDLVFTAYKEPTEGHLRALSDAFAPAALSVVRLEAEHLLSSGWHLGGNSTYTVQILSAAPKDEDRAEVRTRETWTYDEVDASNRRQRCLTEEGEQTYTLRRTGLGWIVEDIQLGPSRRSDC